MKIAISGIGYVGRFNAILLAQHNEVVTLDIFPDKVARLNQKMSPIEDADIKYFLRNKSLNFKATLEKLKPTEVPTFSSLPALIVANRMTDDIEDVVGKGYTCNLCSAD